MDPIKTQEAKVSQLDTQALQTHLKIKPKTPPFPKSSVDYIWPFN
jgi:hypothetical protein